MLMITENESDLLILSLIIECSILTHVSIKIARGLVGNKIYGMMQHSCLFIHIHIHIISREKELN